MHGIDRLVAAAVLAGTLGVVAVKAGLSWFRFRTERRANELLERALRELEREALHHERRRP